MSVVETPNPSNIISRAMNILLKPKTEWDVIDGEAATEQGLFLGYAAILAAIPAIAQIVNALLFPIRVLGLCIRDN